MEENMIVIRDPKNLCFSLDWPKYVDENLKKATNLQQRIKLKKEIEQLLLKYKHGNNIHGQVKPVNHIIFFFTCHKNQT